MEPIALAGVNYEVKTLRGRFCLILAVALCLGALIVGATAQDVTLHGGTSVVLVPTLVTNLAGEPVFGLTVKDFAVYDNGVQQKINLDEDLKLAQTSVVVAVERGHSTEGTLDKVKRIGSLLYPIVGEGRGEVAIVVFDDKPELKQDFTGNLDQATKVLNQLAPGSYGSAILDAVAYSTSLLDARPAENRKVLLLVSGTTDESSKTSIPEVMRQVERSNVLIYSAAYSQTTTSKMGSAIADPSDHPVNLLGLFSSLTRAAKENVPKTVAEMSGGEYMPFHDEKTLENEFAGVNNHFFNQYLLSFTPKKLALGQHSLRVGVDSVNGNVVVTSRTGYWVGDAPQKDTPTAAQAK